MKISSDIYFQLDERLTVTDFSDISALDGLDEEAVGGGAFDSFFEPANGSGGMQTALRQKSTWKGLLRLAESPAQKFFAVIEPADKGQEGFNVHLFSWKPEGMEPEGGETFEKFHSLFDSARSCLWSMNRLADEENWFFTSSITTLCGYTAEEIRKMPNKHFDIVVDDDLPAVLKSRSMHLKPGRSSFYTIDYRIETKEGAERWVREYVHLMGDSQSSAAELSGLLVDITDQKHTEEASRTHEQQLKELNTAKDKFINVLSHDLRSPFTSILGFAEILMNESGLPPKEVQEYLSYIYEASKGQLQFVNYLLDWSRLKTGKMKFNAARLQCQALVYNCVSALTGEAVRKNIDIDVDVDEELFVRADERLLGLVLNNLLSNAVKYSHENSKVEVTVQQFNEDEAEFIVKDWGTGISLEDQGSLFVFEKPFSRKGTGGEKGTGFGLTLAREIVQFHNGKIWFYSEEGKGSEFHITVPLSHNSILLVTSDEQEKETIGQFVKQQYPSYLLLNAKNGIDGAELYHRHLPALIITDHQLQMMTGNQFVESLKPEDGGLYVSIVVCAAAMSNDEKDAYASEGIRNILIKPVKEKQLEEMLAPLVS